MCHKHYENMSHNLSLSKRDLHWENKCADGGGEYDCLLQSLLHKLFCCTQAIAAH